MVPLTYGFYFLTLTRLDPFRTGVWTQCGGPACRGQHSLSLLPVCVSGCEEEERCSVGDLRDAESDGFLSCLLYPDTGACGAYSSELGRSCRPVLPRAPDRTYRKRGGGPNTFPL